jgi:hypothetical protein
MITVMPEGGLCNRLRVVASSLMLAQAAGQGLRVQWLQTPDFNARFDALFEASSLPFELHEGRAMSRPAKALARSQQWLAALRGALVLGPAQTEPGQFDIATQATRIGTRDVFIRTNSRLGRRPGMFDLFKPTGPALEALSRLQPRLAASVGVHIRRTDNLTAAAESTLERFVDLMRAEQASQADTEFFVATDEPAVLRQLQQTFGNKVWEYPKRAYARNDPTAIVDAVVDLYALAATRRLIGSYWSSFTDTAADIHGIPLVIARAKHAAGARETA